MNSVKGDLETKRILGIHFEHASLPGLSDELIEVLTKNSTSEWAEEHRKDGCKADSLMLTVAL